MKRILTAIVCLIFLAGCNVQPRRVRPIDVTIENDVVTIIGQGDNITVTVLETGRVTKFTRTFQRNNSGDSVQQRMFEGCEIIGIASRGGALVVVEWQTKRIHIIA